MPSWTGPRQRLPTLARFQQGLAGAFLAEVFRGGLESISKGQSDAASVLGLSKLQAFVYVLLPQAFRRVLPATGNVLIGLIKDSSLLTIIAVPELTHAASSIQSRHYVPFAAFIVAVLLYWGLCLVVEAGVGLVGRRAEARR